jgi:hypothetical protein
MASEEQQKRESVDHMEADEAKKSAFGGLDFVASPELESRITRKCDFHILPWIFVLWLLAFIDR